MKIRLWKRDKSIKATEAEAVSPMMQLTEELLLASGYRVTRQDYHDVVLEALLDTHHSQDTYALQHIPL